MEERGGRKRAGRKDRYKWCPFPSGGRPKGGEQRTWGGRVSSIKRPGNREESVPTPFWALLKPSRGVTLAAAARGLALRYWRDRILRTLRGSREVYYCIGVVYYTSVLNRFDTTIREYRE